MNKIQIAKCSNNCSFLIDDERNKLEDYHLSILNGKDAARGSLYGGNSGFDIYDDRKYLCIVYPMTCSGKVYIIGEVKDYEHA